MKKFLHTIVLLVVASFFISSCQKDDVRTAASDTVAVKFDVELPEAQPMTKALAEDPDLKTLHVAVFDGNGYKVGFQTATLTSSSADGKTHTYSVTLVSSDEPRVLHFLGNCPDVETLSSTYGNEASLIAGLKTSNEKDAYWQRKVLSSISEEPNEVKAALGTVELIRNYAKVTVTNASGNFTLTGIRVVNAPLSGFVAPYFESGAKAGQFVEKELQKDYANLTSAGYIGYVPSDASLSTVAGNFVPAESATEIACAYVYETAFSSHPYILVKGFFDGSASESYYKVNLIDHDSKEYSLIRSFNFKIEITSVSKAGYATPEAAAASAGSGDISVLSSYEHATNISDTKSQLYISKTAVTVISQSTIEVKYRYIPDLNAGSTVNNNVKSSAEDTYNPIIVSLENVAESAIAGYTVSPTDDDGFRTITINTVEPGATVLSQKLIVKGYGKASDGTYTGDAITRSVNVTVRPTLRLTASCTPRISEVKGTSLPVTIGVESGLPETIFPLDLNIEAVSMSLAPAAGQSLPVQSGVSFSGSGKPSYYFVKTLSYADYSAASITEVDGVKYAQVNANFVTNAANTDSWIYVTNSLFNTAYCYYATGLKNFANVEVTPVEIGTNKTSTLSFTMPDTTPVSVTLTGATHNGQNSFVYTPSTSGAQTIDLDVPSYGERVLVSLSAGGEYNLAKAVGKRYVTFHQNTVAATFSNEPTTGWNNNKADMTMLVGLDAINGSAVTFAASRSIVTPGLAGVVRISRSGNSGNRRYTFQITISDYNPDFTYTYSTGSLSGTFDASSSFTVSSSTSSTITVTATCNGQSVSSSVQRDSGTAGNVNLPTKYSVYNYTAQGPKTTSLVEFNATVTPTTKVVLHYANGSNTGSNNTLTVEYLKTGTAGPEGSITF